MQIDRKLEIENVQIERRAHLNEVGSCKHFRAILIT